MKASFWNERCLKPYWVEAELAVMTEGQPPVCGGYGSAQDHRAPRQKYNENSSINDKLVFRILLQLYGVVKFTILKRFLIKPRQRQDGSISTIKSACKSGCEMPCSSGEDVRMLCKLGRLREAMHAFSVMDRQSIKACSDLYVCLLQTCTKMKALREGKWIHAHLLKSRLKPSIFLWNTLLHMYSKCDNMISAKKVFDKLPERNVFTWTIMISGYARQGQAEAAFELFQQMAQEGVVPDRITLVSMLKACTCSTSLGRGKQIHAQIIRSRFELDDFVGSSLIDMYAKCGSLEQARRVFDKMSKRGVVTLTAMIAGYVQHGQTNEALELFWKMDCEGVKPDEVTFVTVLKACSSTAAMYQGKLIHAHIVKYRFDTVLSVGNALLYMYGKCGSILLARQKFDRMHERDVVSWNTMIAGYSEHGRSEEALELFQQMELQRVEPDEITFCSMLKVCANLTALEQGKQMHACIIKRGLDMDVFVGSSLVDMYSKCGSMDHARHVFDGMLKRDLVLWTAMITGYAQQGYGEEALELFWQMVMEGMKPDKVTFVSVLQACASIGALERGKQIHAHIIKSGFETDAFVGSTLIDMYGKCGSLKHAHQVFDKLPKCILVAWNALIAGYSMHGYGKEALELFQAMHQENVKPNEVTFVSILRACASLAALEHGKLIHFHIIKNELESDAFVMSALVDMYAKSGSIELALKVFNQMPKRDVVLWNSMIAGYAQHGCGKEALELADLMQQEGVKLDCVTFVAILSACSHTGMVDEGQSYFHSMSKDHGIIPLDEHFTCMVDLLGRSGFLEEALEIIKSMPFQPSTVVWNNLLGACRLCGYMDLGERAAECILELEPQSTVAFVLLSSIYAVTGRWDDRTQTRKWWRM